MLITNMLFDGLVQSRTLGSCQILALFGRMDMERSIFMLTKNMLFVGLVENGHLEVAKFLISLENGHGKINIHAENEYAFRWACQNGHLEVAKFLLSLENGHGKINIHA